MKEDNLKNYFHMLTNEDRESAVRHEEYFEQKYKLKTFTNQTMADYKKRYHDNDCHTISGSDSYSMFSNPDYLIKFKYDSVDPNDLNSDPKNNQRNLNDPVKLVCLLPFLPEGERDAFRFANFRMKRVEYLAQFYDRSLLKGGH